MSTIKERIMELGKAKGKNQREIEIESGIGKSTLSRIGQYNPRMETLQKLADYFEVTTDYLLTGEEPKPKQEPNTVIAVGTYEVDLIKTFRQLSEIGKMKILLTVYQELQAEQAPAEEKSAALLTSKVG